MNLKEKLRDALRAYDGIEPAEDSLERLRARADMKPRSFRVSRALLSGVVVVVALGVIVGVRLVDSDRERVSVLPIASATADPSSPPSPTLPSPSPSPSASPSPSPSDTIHYVSEDGVWELFYPKGWYGPDSAPVGEFTNYRSSPREVGLPIKVDLISYDTEPNRTLDDLLAEMCVESRHIEYFECTQVEINGRTWAWVRAYAEADEPAMALDVRTIVGNKVYGALGYVFAKGGQEPAIAQIRKVFESIVLHV